MPRTNAFTLIELLVVVSIIVLLLSLLAPAMDKAIEMAERAKCGANLHAWGVAVPQHYMENDRKLLEAPHHAGPTVGGPFDGQLLPNHPRFRSYTSEGNQFTLDAIGPYISGSTTGPGGKISTVSDHWYCPSSIDSFFYRGWQDSTAASERGEGDIGGGTVVNFMFNDYAYFAKAATLFPTNVTLPKELVANRLESGKILMADTIYRLAEENGKWWFNHSESGYSMHAAWNNEQVWKNAPPPLTGTSQVFGDGSVRWKDGKEFDTQGMHARSLSTGWTTSAPGWNPNGNINFY